MNIVKTGVFLSVLGLAGCASDIDEFVPDPVPPRNIEAPGDVSNFFEEVDVSEKRHETILDISTGAQITLATGTIVNVPSDAFVDPITGEAATGECTFEIVELRSTGEILLYGKATESFGHLLESGGEFFLSAKQGDRSLALARNKRIRFRVPDPEPDPRMELWYLADASSNPRIPRGVETWVEADDNFAYEKVSHALRGKRTGKTVRNSAPMESTTNYQSHPQAFRVY